MYQITDWLYIGASSDVRDGAWKEHGITGIICVNENNEMYFPKFNGDFVAHLWCPFNDPGENLTQTKLGLLRMFAQSFDGKLLVHCMAGANRSSFACIHILANPDVGMSIDDAASLVSEKNPHLTLRTELIDAYEKLSGLRIKGLRETHV